MRQTTLPNGLKVIVQENHTAHVVAVQVWVSVGSADETPDEAGLAHVHEHMLFKGTERRKVGEIAANIEAAGGEINAWTSFDQTVYHVTIASRELDVALDILSDAVQHSTFDATELERELEVVLEELRRGNDTPSRVASEMLFDTAYKAHPYRRPVIGYVDTVKAFTRDKIRAFYRKWYQPRNMCLVVVGDIDSDEVLKKAEGLFDAGLNQETPRPERASEPAQDRLRVAVKAQDIQETHLGIAWPGTRLRDEHTPALDVLSVLLGTGESSRLFRRVKRRAELVNDCYAFSYTPHDQGLVVIGAQIHGEKIEPACKALLKETLRLRYEDPSDAEVEKAKTIILSDAVYQKETVQGIARKLGYFELVAEGTDFEEKYYEAVRQVTPEAVRQVAATYLSPEALSVVTLLPTAHEGLMGEDAVKKLVAETAQELDTEYAKDRIEYGALGVAKVKLDCGATLLACEDNTVPLVSIRTASVGGLLAESDDDNGVGHILAELLVRGTEKYTAEQIVDETDAMAGGISGISGRNSIGLKGDFLKESWERGFELLSSCLLEPAFLSEEIEKERRTQLEDISARKDNLSAVAFDQFARTLYDDHPYRMPLLGTEESVGGITREQVRASFRTQMRPDELTISIVGAVDVPRTIKLVEDRLSCARPHADANKVVRYPHPTAPREARSNKTSRDKEQAHMVLGFLGVSLSDSKRWVLDVLSSVLGGQSGRLFLELRDKQSLAYSVGAFGLEGLDPGYFAVYIGTSPDKLEQAEQGIRAELCKILDEEITKEEIERAHRYLIGSHEIGLQRASARCSTMALNEAYQIGYDDHAKYAERIQAVTPKDVREVAREIVRLDAAIRSVVVRS